MILIRQGELAAATAAAVLRPVAAEWDAVTPAMRRLEAAAAWFSEQLSRHWVGQVHLVFASEALNLADLYQKMPTLARRPAVVYSTPTSFPIPGPINPDGMIW